MAGGSQGAGDEQAGTPRVKKFRQRLNRHKEHLTDRDLDAARRESNGEVFRRQDGSPANHIGEVKDSQQGLRKLLATIQGALSDAKPDRAPSPEEIEALNQVLAEASRLLDYSKRFTP
jgi:putative RNase toxin 28 of polymorphic toxin system